MPELTPSLLFLKRKKADHPSPRSQSIELLHTTRKHACTSSTHANTRARLRARTMHACTPVGRTQVRGFDISSTHAQLDSTRDATHNAHKRPHDRPLDHPESRPLTLPFPSTARPPPLPRDPWSCANRKDPMDTNGQVPKADRGVNHDTPPKASTYSRNQDAGKCSLVSSVDNRMRPSRQLGEVLGMTPTHTLSVSDCRHRQALEHFVPGTVSRVFLQPACRQAHQGLGFKWELD